MRIIHGSGYTTEDKLSFIPLIFENVAKNTTTLLEAAEEWSYPLSGANQARIRIIIGAGLE